MVKVELADGRWIEVQPSESGRIEASILPCHDADVSFEAATWDRLVENVRAANADAAKALQSYMSVALTGAFKDRLHEVATTWLRERPSHVPEALARGVTLLTSLCVLWFQFNRARYGRPLTEDEVAHVFNDLWLDITLILKELGV